MSGLICGAEWYEYYEKFPYFSHESIREGCHPWKMVRKNSTHAIVLVHGLTDSPFFMMDLARFFYSQLNYSVFLPLLHCHGLKKPEGMQGVCLEEWKQNVKYSVKIACQHGETVSIGGLSAGGALGLYVMEKMAQLNGCLYLFSAALELAGGVIGSAKERILRSPFVDVAEFFNRNRPLVGEHPYRYAYVDMGAARELAELIKEIETIIEGHRGKEPFSHWVFAAHSECDDVAGIDAIQKLSRVSVAEKFVFWRIAREENVSHAGLVLSKDILSPNEDKGEPLEKGNPLFLKLVEKIEEINSIMY